MRVRLAAIAILTIAHSALAQREDGENARRRWEWFYQQRAYPFAALPAGALENARAQLRSQQLRSSLLGQAAPAPIAGTSWAPLGPTLIGTRDIGRTSTIAIHPTNGNIMYVGGAQGGVWKTTDGGVTWAPLTDSQCSLAMGSIVIDPVNPQIVYAGTGEQHFSGDSYYGCGVLRTTDGGATWTPVGAASMTLSGTNRPRISRLVLLPSTAGTLATTKLWAAADNGLWFSSDGGATWARRRTGIITDVVLDATNENVTYIGQYQSGVYRSDDAGSVWSALGTGFPTDSVGRINLAVVKSGTTTLLASVANVSSSALRGIYKTTDGGTSWTKLSANNANCAPQCWYDMLIAVHPTDANTVYFGGVSLYRSVDGGATFAIMGGSQIHVDQHFLTFDPQDPGKIYLTSDGGVFKSTDAAVTWSTLNNGLSLTQFYPGISLHPTDPLTVLGGTQDNGTLQTTGSTTWTAVLGGDGGWTAIDHENPAIRYGETQWSSSFGGPRRSDNGSFYAQKVVGINMSDPAQFIPPLVMDPTDPKVLYFGTNKVYRTADRAETWTPFSPQFGGTVTTIAPAPSAPSIVYVGTSAAQLHVGINGTFTQRTSNLPTRFVTDIAVDRSDSLTVYVTFSGFGTGHVYRTTNGGQNWTNVSNNLPDMPVNAVVLDPVSRAYVMIGTDLGVFVSNDSGTTWTALTTGMPNVAVFDIAYQQATGALVAATHGRGMFKLQLNRPLTVALTPLRRRADTNDGSTTAIPDSASVILSGTNAGTSGWTATHTAAATWVTLTTASGTGSGRVVWSRNPTGLTSGMKVDTITITVPGAADSPLRIIDSLSVCSSTPTVAVNVTRRGAALAAGLTLAAPDSALVSFVCGSGTTAWTASAKTGAWITFTTASGNGPGQIRWARRTDSLLAGLHRDTILVTAPGATGSPVKIADSVIVTVAPQFSTVSRTDTMISGTATPRAATTTLTILGDPGASAWTVTHLTAATWTTLTTTNGTGGGSIQWSKNVSNVLPGTYYDTLTVTIPGAPPMKFPDHLIVTEPAVVRSCAVNHFFGSACLDATALKWMDLTGNNDGSFNLGDFIAYLARTPAGPPSGSKP